MLGAGLTGTELADAAKRFKEHPSNRLFAQVVLESDGYVACLGAHKGNDGAIVSIGTGIVGYQVTGGVTNRVGGWGFPLADEGSGAWVGIEALSPAGQRVCSERNPAVIRDDAHGQRQRSPTEERNGTLPRGVAWQRS